MPSAKTSSQNVIDDSDLKSRCYFIELVYERWEFTEEQRKYIDQLRANAINENRIYTDASGKVIPSNGAAGGRTGSASSNRSKQNKTKKTKSSSVASAGAGAGASSSENDLSNIQNPPKYSYSFVLDREMADEIDIKIDNEIEEWIKKEKRSWQFIEMPENDSGLSRAELAANVRSEWLKERMVIEEEPRTENPSEENQGQDQVQNQEKNENENEQAQEQNSDQSGLPKTTNLTEEDILNMYDYQTTLYKNQQSKRNISPHLIDVLSKEDKEEMNRQLDEKIANWKKSREEILAKREIFKNDDGERVERMRMLDGIYQ